MIDTQKKRNSKLAAIIGPLLALLLIGGGVWFLWWYWMGGAKSSQVVHINPATITLPPTRGGFGGGQGGGGFANQAGRRGNQNFNNNITVMQTVRLANGSVTPLSRTVFAITTTIPNSFRMQILQPVAAAPAGQGAAPAADGPPQFKLTARPALLFDGTDATLMQLAVNIATNPMDAKDSGAPPEDVKKMTDALGQNVFMLNLSVSDDDLKDLKQEWTVYFNANQMQRNILAQQLVNTVATLGKKEALADRATFDPMLQTLRQIIPVATEEQYSFAIRTAQANRALATRVPATRRPATTRPVQIAPKAPVQGPQVTPTATPTPTPATLPSPALTPAG